MTLNDKFESRVLKITVDEQEVYILRDFFSPDTHIALLTEARNRTYADSWDKIDHPAQALRSILRPTDSDVLDELYTYLNQPSSLDRLSKVFGNIHKADPVIWWDHEGYVLPMHTDNPSLKKTIQIYLSEEEYPELGTSIGGRDGELVFTLPFKGNTGYYFPNASDIQHGLQTPIPAGIERFSIYIYLYGN